ncbi:MAG: restriction endonuclease subunit S [Bacteroidales bacterium]|nr:restriction endonuclease subunit S [Bacteroidales bacterium]
MEEWKTYRIGDICESVSDTYRGGSASVVLVNTSDVLDGVCLNHTHVLNKDLKGQFKKTFKVDDILYSEIRPANKRFAYIDFDPTDYIASTKLMVIRSSDKVRPRYLFHFLKRQEMLEELQALAESRSGTFPQITFSELAPFEIKLPSLETQDRIVAAIDSFENKIALNNRINHNLEEQAQALYKSWFVDFEPFKDGMFVDSELGMIPEGWRVGTVNEIMDIQSGFPFKSESFVERGQYLLITIKAVQDGQLTISGADSLDAPLPSKMPNYCNLNVGDILLSLTGNVGRVCIVDRDGLLLNQRVAKMAPKKEYNRAYTYFLARNEKFKESMYQIARGTAQLNLSPVETGNLQIVIPPSDVLAFFSRIATPLFKSITATLREMISLQSSRDVLLPQLISGQLTC